jgi:excisionase family DNA binding protein
VTRVEQAERVISARDEEDAVAKVQAEFERPYGYFGSWTRVGSNIEVVGTKPTLGSSPQPVGDGPLLLSIKDAAKHLGVSYGQVYEFVNRGEIEHLRMGRRKFVTRDALRKFIETNTRVGFDRA